MSHSKSVPREFADNFEMVAAHFQLRELGEYELAKETARNDLDNAMPCFAALAREINKKAILI